MAAIEIPYGSSIRHEPHRIPLPYGRTNKGRDVLHLEDVKETTSLDEHGLEVGTLKQRQRNKIRS
jgi:hypothetical protein